jgi:hypothetical protein
MAETVDKTPPIELVLQDIVTTLESVRRENNYQTTISSVERRKNPENEPADMKAVVSQGDPTVVGKDIAQLVWEVDVYVYLFVIESKDDTDPPDTRINKGFCDIVNAVMADTHRGNVANWTEVGDPVFFADGVKAVFTVQYGTARLDQYSRI